MCKIAIADDQTMEAIILDGLTINSVQMDKPSEWQKYNTDWSEEVSDHHSDASVLIGADQPRLLHYMR